MAINQHRRKTASGAQPTAAELLSGEIALNTNAATPGLFFKTTANTVCKIAEHPTQAAISLGGTRHLLTGLTVNTLGHVTGATSAAMVKGDVEAVLTGTVETHKHNGWSTVSIPSGEDLNNYTVSGYYRPASSATGSALINRPPGIGAYYVLHVMDANSTNKVQVLYGNTVDRPNYMRNLYNDGLWYPWRIMYDSSTANLDTVAWRASTLYEGGVSLVGKYLGISANAASATKLQTARTLWGRSFDGTANVSGDLTGVGSLAMAGSLTGVTNIMASGNLDVGGVINNAGTGNSDFVGLNGATVQGMLRFTNMDAILSNNVSGYGIVLRPVGVGTNTGQVYITDAQVRLYGTDGSTSVTTGALRVDGGVGIAGALYAGGALTAVGVATVGSLATAGLITSTRAQGSAPLQVASTTQVNNLNSQYLGGIQSSGYAKRSFVSYTIPAATGWYRIATSAVGIGRNYARFEIEYSVSGEHGKAVFFAGVHYGSNNAEPLITQIFAERFNSGVLLIAYRIVWHRTYNNNYAYLEINKGLSAVPIMNIQMFDSDGWTLLPSVTTGGVPDGYSTKELPSVVGIATTGSIVAMGGITCLA